MQNNSSNTHYLQKHLLIRGLATNFYHKRAHINEHIDVEASSNSVLVKRNVKIFALLLLHYISNWDTNKAIYQPSG